jgi:hypothetical protein
MITTGKLLTNEYSPGDKNNKIPTQRVDVAKLAELFCTLRALNDGLTG